MDSLGLFDLQEKLREKAISPVELTELCYQKIEQLNPKLGAFTHLAKEEARAAAEKAEALYASSEKSAIPPFAGIPIAIKALTTVEGWPANLCSLATGNRVERYSHQVVSELRRAGFILLGQTASPELGALPITESQRYGATRNPWDCMRTAGGSSGGAAVAVRTGMVPIAEASDGGGSIRIPASCCGLVGLKPSRGLVHVGPVLTASGLSTKGILTKTVRETAAVLDIIKSNDPAQWTVLPDWQDCFLDCLSGREQHSRLRVALCVDSPLNNNVHPECAHAAKKVASLFEDLGHEVTLTNPDWGDVDQFVDDFMLYWATLLSEIEVSDEKLFEPHTQHLREMASSTSAVLFQRALTRLQQVSRSITASWTRDIDILVTPTIASLPQRIGEITEGSKEDPTLPIRRSFEMVPFTPWFNVTGQPAISIPVSLSSSGLPIGVQLVAAPRADRLLLQVSAQIEERLDFPAWSEARLTPTT